MKVYFSDTFLQIKEGHMTTNMTTLKDTCEGPIQFCYPQQWLSEAHQGVLHMCRVQEAARRTWRKALSLGDFAWPPVHVSHGTGSRQGNTEGTVLQRHSPVRWRKFSAHGLCLDISCQQAHFGRSQGHKKYCTPSSRGGLSFAF